MDHDLPIRGDGIEAAGTSILLASPELAEFLES